MRQSGGDMGQSVCSRTTQHECCLLQSTTKGQSEPDIHEEFDAYLHQLGSFDAYLCPSGRFMSQMTVSPKHLDAAAEQLTLRRDVMYLVDAIERNEKDKDRHEEPPKVSPP